MNLVYGISRWTNPSRASARHIDNSFGEPLCGGNNRKALTWETEQGEPTCKRCVAKYECIFCGKQGTGFTLGAVTCDRCSRQVERGFNGY